MKFVSITWCLCIAFINILCCHGRIEYHKFMLNPKIYATSNYNHDRSTHSNLSQKFDHNNIKTFFFIPTHSMNYLSQNFTTSTFLKKLRPLSDSSIKRLRTKREVSNNAPSRNNSIHFISHNINLFDLFNMRNHHSNFTIFGPMNLDNPGSSKLRQKYEIVVGILTTEDEVQKENENFAKQVESPEPEALSTVQQSKLVSNPRVWVKDQQDPEPSTTAANGELLNGDGNETLASLISQFKKMYPIDMWKENGWFEDGYLLIINSHWLRFPPRSKIAHYSLAIIYLFVLSAGMFGNLLVIFMFCKCRSLRTPANILVVNLALSDLLMMTELPMLVYNSVYEGPALGQTACTIYGFIGGLTGTVSIGTLSAIAFDRYSVVVYPLDPLRAITGLRAKLSVLFVWIYGIFFAVIPALDFGWGRYVPEGYLTSCSYDYLSDEKDAKIFIFAFFIAAWLAPLVIISFCYAKIFHVVIITRNLGDKAAGSMSSRHCKEQEKRKTELKLAGVVMCVIGLFFAAWTPYTIVSLLGIFNYRQYIEPIYSMVPAMCAKLASCFDPFVYVVTHPKFRQECENLFLCKKQQHRQSTMRQGWSQNQSQKSNNMVKKPSITSEDDVEVVEMGQMPPTLKRQVSIDPNVRSDNGQSSRRVISRSTVIPAEEPIDTISTHISAKGIDVDELPKTVKGNEDLQPPSWYVKPAFVRGNSIKKVVQKIQRMTSNDSLPS